MTRITLSIPDEIYRLIKKYREINWSEVARRAIIEKVLSIKAVREGLTRNEFIMLLQISNRDIEVEEYGYEREREFLEMIRKREKERVNRISRLGKR